MNEKELAQQIAEAFLRLEAEVEARGILLDDTERHSERRWSSFDRFSEIWNGPAIQQRLAESRAAIDSAKDDTSLIRILHEETLRRSKV